jgi:hypothetical protein
LSESSREPEITLKSSPREAMADWGLHGRDLNSSTTNLARGFWQACPQSGRAIKGFDDMKAGNEHLPAGFPSRQPWTAAHAGTLVRSIPCRRSGVSASALPSPSASLCRCEPRRLPTDAAGWLLRAVSAPAGLLIQTARAVSSPANMPSPEKAGDLLQWGLG